MDKHQEALDELTASALFVDDGKMLPEDREAIKLLQELVDQQSILEEYNVTPENIREVLLTGQMFRNNPTFEECIKEWEDRGLIVKKSYCGFVVCYDTLVQTPAAYFYKKTKNYKATCNEFFGEIDYELSILISKTLKALEEMKDE